ncbi:MAG: hypothetical protein HY791_18785 [Deltaproteobacteria bacterium]|nr:hypothetical protein [Deltaproteobacteria bacterium]
MVAPTILAAGDVGPARYPLMARRGLKTVFTDTTKDTLAALESLRPALFVSSAKLVDGPGIVAIEAAKRLGIPVVALCRADEWIVRAELLGAGAYEVLEHHRGDLILKEVTAFTGLGFARLDGGVAQVDVRIRLPDSNEPRRCDVSIDAIVMLTPIVLPIGATGAVSVLWDGPPLDFWTRVLSSEPLASGARTVLKFTALPESERLVLAGILEMALSRADPSAIERPAETKTPPPARTPTPVSPLDTKAPALVEPGDDSEDPEAELFGDLDLEDGAASGEVGVANAPKKAGRKPKPKPLAGPNASAPTHNPSGATALGRIQTKTQRTAPAGGGLVQQEVVREGAPIVNTEPRMDDHAAILREFLKQEE